MGIPARTSSTPTALVKALSGVLRKHPGADPHGTLAPRWAAQVIRLFRGGHDPTEWVSSSLQVRRTEKEGWRRLPYEVAIEAHYMVPGAKVVGEAAKASGIPDEVARAAEHDQGVLQGVAQVHAAQFAEEARSASSWDDEIDRGDLDKVLDQHTVGFVTDDGWKVEGVDTSSVASHAAPDGRITTVLRANVRLRDQTLTTEEDNPHREAAMPPNLRLVRPDEQPPRRETPAKSWWEDPAAFARAQHAQKMFDEQTVSKTGEGKQLRWHMYRGHLQVTEIEHAGKPGKRLRQFNFHLPDWPMPAEHYAELAKFLRMMLSEHATYDAALHWLRKFYEKVRPEVKYWPDPVREQVLRGVDVAPGGSKIEVAMRGGEVNATPGDVSFVWWSGPNQLKGWVSGARANQKVYQWVKANRDKLPQMGWHDIWEAVRNETGIRMDSH